MRLSVYVESAFASVALAELTVARTSIGIPASLLLSLLAELENVREIEIKMRGVKYERCSRFVLDQQAKIEKLEHDGENAKDDKQKKETKLAQLEASIVSEKDGIRDLEDEVKSHQPRQKRIMEECNQVEAEVREAQKAVSKKENEKRIRNEGFPTFVCPQLCK